ncbi:unnamed protein product [Mytilus edulis]|uniref:Uncharacterized protein n=1 Tax=Mytilus edulis TaxID=6550 RepID=A0A8S3R321_MYTED|nr:unnamed protein product [Mytilus edulis]
MEQQSDTNLYHYPDNAFAVLEQLDFFALDMAPNPSFGKGFRRLKKLKSLTFELCYLQYLNNSVFENFSSNINELNLKVCRLHLVHVENDILLPFPKMTKLNLDGTCMHLKQALNILSPYRGKRFKLINFGGLSCPAFNNENYTFVVTITKEMMQYLRTICVEWLDLSDNGIVDFEEDSLLSYDRPECLENIFFKGNRFAFSKGRQMDELKKGSNLTNLDVSFGFSLTSILFQKNSSQKIETLVIDGHPYSSFIVQEELMNNGKIKTFKWRDASLYIHMNPENKHYSSRIQELFKKLKYLEHLDMSKNSLWFLPANVFESMTYLSEIRLSKNLFHLVPRQIMDLTNIKLLDFRQNLLTTLDKNTRVWADSMNQQHGLSILMEDNAFECNCDNLDFIDWINKTKVKLDSRSYKCTLVNGSLITVRESYEKMHDLFSHCESSTWLTVASTLLSTCFVTEAESIENSRHVIFLLTPSFKSSEDYLFAVERVKHEKRIRNIENIIVLAKDISLKDIPTELTYIWNYVSFIQWPDDTDDFDTMWQQLRLWVCSDLM